MSFEREPCSVRAIDSEQIEHYIAKGRQLRADAAQRWASQAFQATAKSIKSVWNLFGGARRAGHQPGGAVAAPK